MMCVQEMVYSHVACNNNDEAITRLCVCVCVLFIGCVGRLLICTYVYIDSLDISPAATAQR